jgi:hypothetical protein
MRCFMAASLVAWSWDWSVIVEAGWLGRGVYREKALWLWDWEDVYKMAGYLRIYGAYRPSGLNVGPSGLYWLSEFVRQVRVPN